MRNPLLGLRAVHDAERRPLLVELDERFRRPFIHLQTLAHDLLVVVGTLHQLTAAFAADRRRRRPVLQHLRIRTALRANQAAREAAHQLVLGHSNVHDDQRPVVPLSDDLIERVGLRHRPRKPVEHEPALRIRTQQPLAHDRDHRLVVHQFAAIHPLLRAQRHRQPLLDLVSKDVAGRNLQQPPFTRESPRLGALPGPRRSHHDHLQRHTVSPRAARARRCPTVIRHTGSASAPANANTLRRDLAEAVGLGGPVPAPRRVTLVYL